jgi:hypothetical protein
MILKNRPKQKLQGLKIKLMAATIETSVVLAAVVLVALVVNQNVE